MQKSARKLEDGNTVLQRFIKNHQRNLSNDVRRLLLDWQNVIEGIFEVKEIEAGKFIMKNLINEQDYSVYATATMETTDLEPGDFVTARIVQALNFHIFTGALRITRSDGSLQQRAIIYKTAVDFQLNHPKLAFKDNPEAGLSFLIQYRQLSDIFKNPELHYGNDEAKDLVLDYLKSDSITDLPFRKLAKRFMGRFNSKIFSRGWRGCDQTVSIAV